jgi:hypothetical protein
MSLSCRPQPVRPARGLYGPAGGCTTVCRSCTVVCRGQYSPAVAQICRCTPLLWVQIFRRTSLLLLYGPAGGLYICLLWPRSAALCPCCCCSALQKISTASARWYGLHKLFLVAGYSYSCCLIILSSFRLSKIPSFLSM